MDKKENEIVDGEVEQEADLPIRKNPNRER